MAKIVRIILFAVLLLSPIIFYKLISHGRGKVKIAALKEAPAVKPEVVSLPMVALIFDDLGDSLKELKEIYSLNAPLTVSIIPGLKYSKNLARIAADSGFSVMVHLPLEPRHSERFVKSRVKLISASMPQSQKEELLAYYLDAVSPVVGVNNHMGSLATEDKEFMRLVLREVKKRGLFFIDSRTSLNSVACEVAKEEGVVCQDNYGFLDSVYKDEAISAKINMLVAEAQKTGRLIVIGHPKEKTLRVLRQMMPALKKQVKFVTISDYLGETIGHRQKT